MHKLNSLFLITILEVGLLVSSTQVKETEVKSFKRKRWNSNQTMELLTLLQSVSLHASLGVICN